MMRAKKYRIRMWTNNPFADDAEVHYVRGGILLALYLSLYVRVFFDYFEIEEVKE